MKTIQKIFLLSAVFLVISSFVLAQTTNYKAKTLKDSNSNSYKAFENDPLALRIYTLDNGLKVYLADNKDVPRIQTYIAIKAGSTYDPKDNTGLAHYLEHMMFKGTDEIGTLDWEKEKVLLQEISDLYEQHKKETDKDKKAEIYAKIDSVSLEASKYVVANEYDKIVSSLGANRTNAYTSNEQVVFINDIPTNEFEKWCKLESERFSQLVLRLFHTELETVYEEFNMGQDNDNRKTYYKLLEALFPTHPYGTQTTIGKAEHLKNPSMENIHNYWKTYYVPNNMAICISGDINFEETVGTIEKYFGKLKNSEVPKKKLPVEAPLKYAEYEVFGPSYESIWFAYRFDGINSYDEKCVTIIDMMLNNSAAGLIDLNLVQKQKVLRAGCSPSFMKEYGFHRFYGMARQGQTLDEVKDLILEQIEKIKKGEFDEWLMQAVINDLKLNTIRSHETNNGAASAFVYSFVNEVPWPDYLSKYEELENLTKQEIVDFANKYYNDNYVVVYKRTGEDTSVVKVEKPKISNVPLNRTDQSEFLKEITQMKSEKIDPVFINYEESLQKSELKKGVDYFYIENPSNEIFSLYYIIDIGKKHNPKLPLAVEYLQYLGTNKYTPDSLQKLLYSYGIQFNVNAGDERSYVYISGLKKSFEKGIELLEHILAEAKPDKEAYKNYVEGILKSRSDAKKDKGTIMFGGLLNYGKYGEFSPFTNILSEKELNEIEPSELTDFVKEINSFPHAVFYYGQHENKEVEKLLKKHHNLPEKLKGFPEPIHYTSVSNQQNEVYFVDYDMVQTQLLLVNTDVDFNKEIIPAAKIFGEYFGRGLSSIVFQEIRESKALAYSAFSVYSVPRKMDEKHYVYAYVATQADKLNDATQAMVELMNDMPKAELQFNAAKESILKNYQTERIIKQNIFWTWLSNNDLGLEGDYRKVIYDSISGFDLEQLNAFFNDHIKGKKYRMMIIGKKDMIDFDALKSFGEVKELTLEQVFNY